MKLEFIIFMVNIIDGKALAEKIKDEIVKEIVKINQGRIGDAYKRPNLAIILVGEREDSKLYVDLKEKEAKKVGIDTHLYKCNDKISEREILDMIDCLNNDTSVDAILVQLPLPAGFDTDAIIMSINPAKDVDGFHPANLAKLFKTCDNTDIIPPVHEAVIEILKSIAYNLKDKQACLISNSDIFGKSLTHILTCQGAKVAITNVKDKAMAKKTSVADILITAVGKPEFIKKDLIKKDAVIIDIGITKRGKEVVGDVDFNSVKDKAGYLTPVPGGVGPLTIAMAFKNTLKLYKLRNKI